MKYLFIVLALSLVGCTDRLASTFSPTPMPVPHPGPVVCGPYGQCPPETGRSAAPVADATEDNATVAVLD